MSDNQIGSQKAPLSPSVGEDLQLRSLPPDAAVATGGPISDSPSLADSGFSGQAAARSPRTAPSPRSTPSLQLHGTSDASSTSDPIATASSGFTGGGSPLPHQSTIEKSFGTDMSGVQTFTGGAASAACDTLGAQAYTMGNKIAFKDSSPSVQLAAHEAAHTVQQSQGVSLKGGMGTEGDQYEVQAEQAAAKAASGQSAVELLGTGGGSGSGSGGSVQSKAVQLLGTPLDEKAPDSEPKPKFGESPGKQRRFSPDQYVEMWEQEQGRKMTKAERSTIDRGCIGITATNLSGGGNPLDRAEGIYANFDKAQEAMVEKNRVLDWMAENPEFSGQVPDARYVLFAKLFWSNQSDDWEERLQPDEDAFKPDPETGEVDMTGYKYRAQSKWGEEDDGGQRRKSSYVNFDYGFWDETSKCFWHANHMEYKDKRRLTDPMKVLQSTKGKFIAGYFDFDRVIFCIAPSNNYDPGLAAMAYAG